jgi:hypothetical protein
VYEQTGVMPEELKVPPLPEELAYLWHLFWRLNRKRQNGMGVNPLASAEILAWQARQGVQFEPWEHEVIDRLDTLFVVHQNKA